MNNKLKLGFVFIILIAISIVGIMFLRGNHNDQSYIRNLHAKDIVSAEIYQAAPNPIEIPIKTNVVSKIVEWLSNADYEGVSRSVYETQGWGPAVILLKTRDGKTISIQNSIDGEASEKSGELTVQIEKKNAKHLRFNSMDLKRWINNDMITLVQK